MRYEWILTVCSAILPYALGGSYLQIVSDPYNQFVADIHPLPATSFGNVISLALGFASEAVNWDGLSAGDIFQRPKAALIVSAKSHGDVSLSGVPVRQKFQLNLNGNIDVQGTRDDIISEFGQQGPLIIEYANGVKVINVPEELKSNFQRFPSSLSEMIPLIQRDGSVLKRFKTTHLNISSPEDLNFLSELQLMKEVLDQLSTKHNIINDGSPDLLYFELSGLAELQAHYGLSSVKVTEAENILSEFLKQYFDAMKGFYDNDILICFTMHDEDQTHHRFARETETVAAAPKTEKELNVATLYSEDFAVMFNIILWMSVVLALAVYASSYMLMFMDPGDSIIYRMTAQRIKID